MMNEYMDKLNETICQMENELARLKAERETLRCKEWGHDKQMLEDAINAFFDKYPDAYIIVCPGRPDEETIEINNDYESFHIGKY